MQDTSIMGKPNKNNANKTVDAVKRRFQKIDRRAFRLDSLEDSQNERETVEEFARYARES